MRKLLSLVCLVAVGACATAQDLDTSGSNVTLDGSEPGNAGGTTGGGSGGGGSGLAGGTSSAGTGNGGAKPLGNGGSGATGSGGSSAGGGSSEGTGGTKPGGGGTSSAGGKAGGGAGGKAGGGAGGALNAGGRPPGDAGPACVTGQKICASDGLCWPPSPQHGCDMGTACTPCPTPPPNGTEVCSSGQCDFTCIGGYVKNGSSCVSNGAGGTGSGGVTGSGGAPPACVDSQCGGGIPFYTTGCCKSDGTCGTKVIWTGGTCK